MGNRMIAEKGTVSDLSGKTFGRWLVQNEMITTPKGERKWMCRCECGTFRYVLERSLVYGGSESCGCLRKEKSREAVFHDLTGQKFGELTVIRQLENPGNNKGALWLCKCSCGAEYQTYGTLLMTGVRTRCTESIHEKNYSYTDITGQKFAHLTASIL